MSHSIIDIVSSVPVPPAIAEAEADLAKIREQLTQLDYQRSVASECGGSLDWSQSSPLAPKKRRQIYRDIVSDIRKARAAEAAATKRRGQARALYRTHLVRQLIPAQQAAVDRVERAFSELLSAWAELDATAAAIVAADGPAATHIRAPQFQYRAGKHISRLLASYRNVPRPKA